MIVKCGSCQTEFSLDDRQVGGNGVTVRCSMCSYVFRVQPGDGRPDEQPWQIRTVDELLFTAPDLKTLRRWILEDRLHPDDRVSRTGRTWLRLGDMPEFADAFRHYSQQLKPVLQQVPAPATSTASASGQTYGGSVSVPVASPTPGAAPLAPPVVGQVPPVGHGQAQVPARPGGQYAAPVQAPIVPSPSHAGSQPGPAPVAGMSAGTPSGVAAPPTFAAPPQAQPNQPAPAGFQAPVATPQQASPGAYPVTPSAPSPSPQVQAPAPVQPVQGTPNYGAPNGQIPVQQPVAQTPVQPAPAQAPSPSQAPAAFQSSPAAASSEFSNSWNAASVSSQRSAQSSIEDEYIEKKSAKWPWVAGLLLVGGAAVILGVPDLRQQVTSYAKEQGILGGGDVASKKTDTAAAVPEKREFIEVGLAESALRSLSLGALTQADEGLSKRLAQSDLQPNEKLSLNLVRAELALHGALLHFMASTVDASAGPELRRRSDSERDEAKKILASLAEQRSSLAASNAADRDESSETDFQRDKRIRVYMGLMGGQLAAQLETHLPAEGADNLKALIAAEALWSDPEISKEDIAKAQQKLNAVARPSALVQSANLLAKFRAEGSEAALSDAQLLVAGASDHPVASRVVALAAAKGGDGDQAKEDAKEASPPPPAVAEAKKPAPAAEKTTPASAGTGKKSGGPKKASGDRDDAPIPTGGKGVDRLIDDGCSKVEGSDASGGIKTLLKAFDRAPTNLDVLFCLATGYKKVGRKDRALFFYERTLSFSPKHVSALRGAASMAERMGQDPKAEKYYKRLLEVAPNDSKAKKYLESADAE